MYKKKHATKRLSSCPLLLKGEWFWWWSCTLLPCGTCWRNAVPCLDLLSYLLILFPCLLIVFVKLSDLFDFFIHFFYFLLFSILLILLFIECICESILLVFNCLFILFIYFFLSCLLYLLVYWLNLWSCMTC